MGSVNTVKPRKTVITLDKKRPLVFSLNAFAAIEDEYPSTEAAFTAMEQGSLKALRCVLTAALNAGQPEDSEPLTAQEVGSMVTMDNMADVTEALTEALTQAVPDSAPKGGKSGNV